VNAALLLASVLHALALTAVYFASREVRQPVSLGRADSSEVEVDVVLDPPADPSTSVASTLSEASSSSTPTPPSVKPLRASSALAERAAPSAALDAADSPSPEPGSVDEQPETGSAPDRVVDLGLGPGGWQKWARLPQSEAPAKPKKRRRSPEQAFHPPPASTTGGLLEGLEAHDRELGLGPSGPVIGALYRAAHSPAAPQVGVARFLVTVLKTGSVEVSLLGASDHAEAWARVGVQAAEAIRQAPPRIDEPRSGTRMVVAIIAEEVFPDGTRRTELAEPHLEAVAPRLRTTTEAQDKLKQLNPVAGDTGAPVTGQTAIVELPGLYLAGRGKVCSYRLGITPFGPMLGGGCELSNLGTTAQRRVSTRVDEAAMF
jgi:hypothetical protein